MLNDNMASVMYNDTELRSNGIRSPLTRMTKKRIRVASVKRIATAANGGRLSRPIFIANQVEPQITQRSTKPSHFNSLSEFIPAYPSLKEYMTRPESNLG